MRVRKAIKKIAALGVGVSMIGATILGATAADLSQYPDPLFIKNGQFDGTIVIGDAPASPEDVVGAIDIATSLQYSVGQPVSTTGAGGGAVSVSGDAVAISQANDMLEIRERMGWVKETLTEFDLAGLQGGTIVTDEGATDYNQYLRFEDSLNSSSQEYIHSGFVDFTEDEDDIVGDYLYYNDGRDMFEYQLEFEEGVESGYECQSGITTCGPTNTRHLNDLEDEELNILGKVFTIVNARTLTSGLNIELELLGGDVLDTMEEGETRVYTIDGKEYTVNLLIVSDTSSSGEGTLKFVVNGEVTDELEDGETDVLRDGIEIGVRDIMPNEAEEETGGDLVEFFLGANKVQLNDGNYSDDEWQQGGVEIHQENIEDARVKIKAGNASTSVLEVNSITYRLEADGINGDVYVPPGHGAKEYIDEPEGFLSDAWDIRYEGLSDTGVSIVRFDARGDDSYDFEFTSREGLEYDFPLVDNSKDDLNFFKWGDSDDDFIFQEGYVNGTAGLAVPAGVAGSAVDACGNHFNIDEDDYFLVTDTPMDENSFSHVLSYESIDTVNKQLTFSDEATGQREVTYEVPTAGNNVTGTNECVLGYSENLIVGGNTFRVWVSTGDNGTGSVTEKAYPILVDQNSDGTPQNTTITLTVNGGGIFNFGSQPEKNYTTGAETGTTAVAAGGANGWFNVSLTTLPSEFDGAGILNTGAPEVLKMNISSSGTQVDLRVYSPQLLPYLAGGLAGDPNPGNITMLQMESLDEEDIRQGLSTYGVFFEQTDEDSDADDLTIEYPLSQRGADVFVVIGETQTSRVGGASGSAVVLNPINVGASKLASEIKGQEKSMNMIVVGGPCINTAAATLMGSDKPLCGEESGLVAGEGVIKLFENDGYVAMLVAGYDKADTRRASKVVAEYEDWADKFVGDELVVTGTSMADIDVATPTTSFMTGMGGEEAADEGDEAGDEEGEM